MKITVNPFGKEPEKHTAKGVKKGKATNQKVQQANVKKVQRTSRKVGQ